MNVKCQNLDFLVLLSLLFYHNQFQNVSRIFSSHSGAQPTLSVALSPSWDYLNQTQLACLRGQGAFLCLC